MSSNHKIRYEYDQYNNRKSKYIHTPEDLDEFPPVSRLQKHIRLGALREYLKDRIIQHLPPKRSTPHSSSDRTKIHSPIRPLPNGSLEHIPREKLGLDSRQNAAEHMSSKGGFSNTNSFSLPQPKGQDHLKKDSLSVPQISGSFLLNMNMSQDSIPLAQLSRFPGLSTSSRRSKPRSTLFISPSSDSETENDSATQPPLSKPPLFVSLETNDENDHIATNIVPIRKNEYHAVDITTPVKARSQGRDQQVSIVQENDTFTMPNDPGSLSDSPLSDVFDIPDNPAGATSILCQGLASDKSIDTHPNQLAKTSLEKTIGRKGSPLKGTELIVDEYHDGLEEKEETFAKEDKNEDHEPISAAFHDEDGDVSDNDIVRPSRKRKRLQQNVIPDDESIYTSSGSKSESFYITDNHQNSMFGPNFATETEIEEKESLVAGLNSEEDEAFTSAREEPYFSENEEIVDDRDETFYQDEDESVENSDDLDYSDGDSSDKILDAEQTEEQGKRHGQHNGHLPSNDNKSSEPSINMPSNENLFVSANEKSTKPSTSSSPTPRFSSIERSSKKKTETNRSSDNCRSAIRIIRDPPKRRKIKKSKEISTKTPTDFSRKLIYPNRIETKQIEHVEISDEDEVIITQSDEDRTLHQGEYPVKSSGTVGSEIQLVEDDQILVTDAERGDKIGNGNEAAQKGDIENGGDESAKILGAPSKDNSPHAKYTMRTSGEEELISVNDKLANISNTPLQSSNTGGDKEKSGAQAPESLAQHLKQASYKGSKFDAPRLPQTLESSAQGSLSVQTQKTSSISPLSQRPPSSSSTVKAPIPIYSLISDEEDDSSDSSEDMVLIDETTFRQSFTPVSGP